MTGEQLRELIRSSIAGTLSFVSTWNGMDTVESLDCDDVKATGAVLAAIRAAGLVVGVKISNEEFERTHGIAVVRVVE